MCFPRGSLYAIQRDSAESPHEGTGICQAVGYFRLFSPPLFAFIARDRQDGVTGTRSLDEQEAAPGVGMTPMEDAEYGRS
jgi:hypothetical protein